MTSDAETIAEERNEKAIALLHPYIREIMSMTSEGPYSDILTHAFALNEVARALPDVDCSPDFRPGMTATPELVELADPEREWPDCEYAQLLISTEGWVGNLRVTPAHIQAAIAVCDARLDDMRAAGLGLD